MRADWAENRLITVEADRGIKRLGNPYVVVDDRLWVLFELEGLDRPLRRSG